MSAAVDPFRGDAPHETSPGASSPGGCATAAPHTPSQALHSRAGAAVALSEPMMILLSAMAAHDNCSVAKLVSRMAERHAREIGCTALMRAVLEREGDLDHVPAFRRRAPNRFLQGGEAASRLAHNQETAGASPAPATRSETITGTSGGP